MNLSLRDIILIAIISLVSFPILYATMMLATGKAKVVIVDEQENANTNGKEMKYIKFKGKMDSLQVLHSESYIASVKEGKELTVQKERLIRQQERIAILNQDLEIKRRELMQERKKFEGVVASTEELEMKRIKQLAKVYGAMKPLEAAHILETLNDALFIKILNAIPDDRQKAKIVANISKDKASRISKKMGKNLK